MKRYSVWRQGFWIALVSAIFLLAYGCGEKVEFKQTNAPAGSPPEQAAPNAPNAEPGSANDDMDRPSTTAENPGVPLESPPAGNAFAAPKRNVPQPIIIPDGRRLTVRLLHTVSSKTANPGQRFDAELASPLVVNGMTVLPRGTPLRGRVVASRSSGRLHKPGYLRLTLDSIRARDGRWVGLRTTSIFVQGGSHKKRNLALIGGGTGVGAVIGAIAGGGKGAAIGALSGAGAGTVGAYATGKKDVTLPAEHRLSFSTTRQIAIG